MYEERLTGPARLRQAGRTGPWQLSPGWLGVASRAGNFSRPCIHTFTADSVFSFERWEQLENAVLSLLYILWLWVMFPILD